MSGFQIFTFKTRILKLLKKITFYLKKERAEIVLELPLDPKEGSCKFKVLLSECNT